MPWPTKSESRFLEFGKLLLSAAIAIVGSTWAASRVLAGVEHRLTVVETKQEGSEKSVDVSLTQIREDLRDLRQALLPARAEERPR